MSAFPALSGRVVRGVVVAVVALVAVAGVVLTRLDRPTKTVTAQFDAAVGLYPGSDVKVLGITVGSVTKIKPQGTTVKVWMRYRSALKVPANAVAVIVAPSLVSDRFVQLAPAYTGGDVLADHSTIDLSRTAVPVELDDIYAALNQLNVALGPDGSNKDGALTDLINVAAANLDGNGAALGESIEKLSQAAKTLATGREDLFGTVKNLQAFTTALAQSDQQVRAFNEKFAIVAQQLADERASLGAALKNLATALNDVAAFIKKNKATLHKSITALEDVTGVLVEQKGALDEILRVAPTALSNLAHAYNDVGATPAGTLDIRANFVAQNLADPAQLCGLLNQLGQLNGLDPTNEVYKTCALLADQLLCLPAVLGPVAGSLPLPVCKTNQVPGLPNLPKIPGLPT